MARCGLVAILLAQSQVAFGARVDDASDDGVQAGDVPSWAAAVVSWTKAHLPFMGGESSSSASVHEKAEDHAPAVKTVAAPTAVKTTPTAPKVADAAATATKDLFDGSWKSSAGDAPVISGDTITWEGKYKAKIISEADHEVKISMDGAEVSGTLAQDANKLVWADGDVWTRSLDKASGSTIKESDASVVHPAVAPSLVEAGEQIQDVDKAAKKLAEQYASEAADATAKASKQVAAAADAQAKAAKAATEVAEWKAKALKQANRVVTLKASAASERQTATDAEEVKAQAERDEAKAMNLKASAVTRALQAEEAVSRAEQDALVAAAEAPKSMAEAEVVARDAMQSKWIADKESGAAALAEMDAKQAERKAMRAAEVRAAAERAEADREAREAELEETRVHEEKAKAYKDAADAENHEWEAKVKAHKSAVARLQTKADSLEDR